MALVQETLPFVTETTDSEPDVESSAPDREDNPVKRVAQKYKLKVDGDAAAKLAADLEAGIERAADLCHLDPPVCKDNLGIGREQMPQIDERTLPFFLDAWRKTGTRVIADVVPVGKLKATQMEINAGKVAGMAQAAVDGKFPTIQAPVIVSSDSFVLDGHHRWAALMVLSPNNSMQVYRVEVPIQSLLQAARQFEGTTFAGMRTANPSALGELHRALEYFDEGKPAKAEAPVRRAAEQLEPKAKRSDWAQKTGGYDDTWVSDAEVRRSNSGGDDGTPMRVRNPSQQQLDPAATEPDLDDDSDLDDPEDEPIDYGDGDGDVPDEWVGDMPEDARMHAQLENAPEEPLTPAEKAIRDSSKWENSNSAERNVPKPTVVVPPPSQAEWDEQKRQVGVTAAIGTALASQGGIVGERADNPNTGAVIEHLQTAVTHLRSVPNIHETRRGGFDPVGSAQYEIERAIKLLKSDGRTDNPHLDDVSFREPQSLHFPKDRFTRGKALDWCEENGCVPIKGEQTENQWRLRLAPPEDFRQGQFRTFTTHDGVQVILGELKRPRNPVGIVPLANLISAAAGTVGAVKSVAAPEGGG